MIVSEASHRQERRIPAVVVVLATEVVETQRMRATVAARRAHAKK